MHYENGKFEQRRSFSFSNEVERMQQNQVKRDLVLMSAAALFSVYAVGIAVFAIA